MFFFSAPTNFVQALSSQSLKVTSSLAKPAHTGKNDITFQVMDGTSPVTHAKLVVTVSMTSMDMGTTHPAVKELGKGKYQAAVNFSMGGKWLVAVGTTAKGYSPDDTKFNFNATAGATGMSDMGDMSGMDGMSGMKGMSSMSGMGMMMKPGKFALAQEGSGTSLLPSSSPMFMKMLPKSGRYEFDLMGSFSLNYSGSGGPRGHARFFSNSMPMLMVRREVGGGTLGFNFMFSLDPIFNGEYGYPDLFQTGETAHGNKLVDYQHPHDLISEITTTYRHPVGKGVEAFVYGGPVGEPALGGPMFLHRPSGMEIPEAPISHHWFDSTHISWGVVTLGANTNHWQVDGSVFNGHEPNENRYLPDPLGLNSTAIRTTYNPTKNLSFSSSFGYLNSPESSSPGIDEHRITSSAIWSLPLGKKQNLSTTALFGEKIVQGARSDAYLLETTLFSGSHTYFFRFENVAKDELIGVPTGDYRINKFLFGGVQNVISKGGFDAGVGGYVGLYSFPGSLTPYYGHSPVTLGVFLRVRPSWMK